MTTFRSNAYDAFVDVLKAQRLAKGLSQIQVAEALPRWLGFDHTTVNKIEHRRRNVSHIEARELARVLKTTVVKLDKKALAVEQAMTAAAGNPLAKRLTRPARKK